MLEAGIAQRLHRERLLVGHERDGPVHEVAHHPRPDGRFQLRERLRGQILLVGDPNDIECALARLQLQTELRMPEHLAPEARVILAEAIARVDQLTEINALVDPILEQQLLGAIPPQAIECALVADLHVALGEPHLEPALHQRKRAAFPCIGKLFRQKSHLLVTGAFLVDKVLRAAPAFLEGIEEAIKEHLLGNAVLPLIFARKLFGVCRPKLTDEAPDLVIPVRITESNERVFRRLEPRGLRHEMREREEQLDFVA